MSEATLVTSSETRHGWAIGILQTYDRFAVIRINPRNRYVMLSLHKTLGTAQKAADTEWKLDKGGEQ